VQQGGGQHDALDALVVGITATRVNHILDCDIRSSFDAVSQEWLIRFLQHRIADPRIIRLIRKWLKAGVLEDGVVTVSDRGTGQGSVISPLLANVYLHYVFDLWAARWRRREATGDMILVRYADDIVVGFEHEADARRFRDAMRERLEEFALSLHPDKTRLIGFGRHAAARRRSRGLGKPETFAFLGFTFICGTARRGGFQLQRKSRRDRVRAKLEGVKEELRRRMHQPIPAQGLWLRRVVAGFFAYHGVPTNRRALAAFRFHVFDLWRRSAAAARGPGSRGSGRCSWPTPGSPGPGFFTPGRSSASPPSTRGGRSYGVSGEDVAPSPLDEPDGCAP
jgi:RNA-directed DNA polymerase